MNNWVILLYIVYYILLDILRSIISRKYRIRAFLTTLLKATFFYYFLLSTR